jgi:cysteine desulfurase
MYANNEIGTINPIKEISKVVRKFKKDNQTEMPYVHTDASQAAHYLDMNLSALNIDLLTIDASKLYGPKGIGLLYKKSHVEIEPLMFGGGQENGLRPGTENVAAIVGLCESLMIAESLKIKESARIKKLRDYFISHVLKISDCTLNGSLEYRLPNNINICFKGMNAEYAVFLLDAAGFCVSSVTSCLNLSEESSSYVIDALQPPGQDSKKNEKNNKCSSSSLRITLGRSTQKKEISSLLKVLPDIIDKARKN